MPVGREWWTGPLQTRTAAAEPQDMGEPGGASTAVPVYVGGLDGTMARSVVAYFEARQVGRFAAAERRGATILLIDLDQPGAGAEIDAATEEQIVVGVGFGREPAEARCRHYAQKPLTGSVLIDTLSDVLLLLGASPATTLPRRTAVGRASHARDIFTTGRPYAAWDQVSRQRAWPRPFDPAQWARCAQPSRAPAEAPPTMPAPRLGSPACPASSETPAGSNPRAHGRPRQSWRTRHRRREDGVARCGGGPGARRRGPPGSRRAGRLPVLARRARRRDRAAGRSGRG